MIFKFQYPVNERGPKRDVLVYNEDKSVYYILPMDTAYADELFGDKVKFYGTRENRGMASVINKVEDQSW